MSGKGRFWEADSDEDDDEDNDDNNKGEEDDEDDEEDDFGFDDNDDDDNDKGRRRNKQKEDGDEEEEEDEDGDRRDNDDEETDEANRANFFRKFESDSDDEDRQVELKNRRRKAIDAIASFLEKIRNAMRNHDWSTVESEFDELMRTLQRLLPTVLNNETPMIFIKCFAEMQEASETSWADNEGKKKMAKQKLKSLTVVRQRLRKLQPLYEGDLAEYSKSPEEYATQAEEQARKFVEDEHADEEEQSNEMKDESSVDALSVENVTKDNVDVMLQKVINSRGRKKTNTAQIVEILEKLVEFSPTTELTVKCLLTLISALFDQRSKAVYMDIDSWHRARSYITKLLDILEKNPTTEIDMPSALPESAAPTPTPTPTSTAASTPATTPAPSAVSSEEVLPTTGTRFFLPLSIASVVERMDDEFTRSLQNIDPHTNSYLNRLQDEKKLYELLVNTQRYCEQSNSTEAAVRVIIRRIEHIYYKHSSLNDKIEKEVMKNLGLPETTVDSAELMHSLCSYLYKNSADRIRSRTLLCHVYHYALHDHYYKARDLLLMSHLQESIQRADVESQVLYNRAMVQIGLCAFRHGFFRDAQLALQEIFNTGKQKELLAQGMVNQRFVQKTVEQERLEKQRQIPFHMHINLELLECIFFACTMLLEVPAMAAASHDGRKRISSKPFRRILDTNDRQPCTGPPETTRDHIVQATKALIVGDWQLCNTMMSTIKIWNLMPNKDEILSMLAKKIQEEALRSFLFTYSPFYDSLSLDHLAQMFDMPVSAVHGILSKMIINDELQASVDQVSNTVSLQHVEPTRLQYLALQFADRMAGSVEANERMFDLRTGTFGNVDAERTDRNKRGMKTQSSYGARDGGGGKQDYGRGQQQRQQGRGGGGGGGGNRQGNQLGGRRNYSQNQNQQRKPSYQNRPRQNQRSNE